jgi:hypothetical protein
VVVACGLPGLAYRWTDMPERCQLVSVSLTLTRKTSTLNLTLF